MRIQYFTYVLNPTDQQILFENKEDKNIIFKRILTDKKEPLKFATSQHTPLAFVKKWEKDNYAIFQLGKGERIDIHLPPEEGFREEQVENWPYCYVLFNFDDDPKTGQKIAFQYNSEIFRHPVNSLSALAKKINDEELLLEGYALTINPVTDEKEFWEVVKKHKNEIQKLTLTFNSPNLFKLKNTLSGALKEVQSEYGATKTQITLENPEGKLKVPENKLMKQSADYVSKGQGSYSLKVKSKKTVIREKDIVETKELDINLESEKDDTIMQTLDRIFKKDA